MNLAEEINKRKEEGLYRSRRIIETAQGPVVTIRGEPYLNFGSNDYLGLANHPLLKETMIEAINEYGIGAGSSQLLIGHSSAHAELEKKLANFLDRDAALVFSSGYQANLAIASTLITSDTIILQDKLCHASLIDAAIISKGKLVRYSHNDVTHLATLLEKYKDKDLMVMTEGVFSMDGDVALLNEIVSLCETYNVFLVVDDAHGIGVLGKTGGGLLEDLGLNQSQVPLLIGTFGKAFGASGAFISGSSLLIDSFVQKARTYIYSTALMPAIAVTINKAIDLIVEGVDLRNNLFDLVDHYKSSVKNAGLSESFSATQIQPLIIGDVKKTVSLSEELFSNNIIVSAIRPPTVREGTARLRISITAAHTLEQVEFLVKSISAASTNE